MGLKPQFHRHFLYVLLQYYLIILCHFFIRPNFGVNVYTCKEECFDVWSMISHCLRFMLEEAKKDPYNVGSVTPAMKLGMYVHNGQ